MNWGRLFSVGLSAALLAIAGEIARELVRQRLTTRRR